MDWIDIALRVDEEGVTQAIGSLKQDDRLYAISSAMTALGLTGEDLERTMLRVLIERARPLALPAALWARSVDESNDPSDLVRAHFKRNGIGETPDRMRRALALYAQFTTPRDHPPISESMLKRCDFRCQHCGLAFCDEQLARRSITSPWKLRGKPKVDRLKPHWNGDVRMLEPTVDHHWPISLYGDNSERNLRVLCQGCNFAKEEILAFEQIKPAIGLTPQASLLSSAPVQFSVFYAQIRRAPECANSGKNAEEAELTVEFKDPYGAAVLDNLRTVESPGI